MKTLGKPSHGLGQIQKAPGKTQGDEKGALGMPSSAEEDPITRQLLHAGVGNPIEAEKSRLPKVYK